MTEKVLYPATAKDIAAKQSEEARAARADLGWLGIPVQRRAALEAMAGLPFTYSVILYWMTLFRKLLYEMEEHLTATYPQLYSGMVLDPTWSP